MISRTNQEFLEYLSRKASISVAFAQILVNRGIKDVDSIKAFLNPSLENLHDPYLMPQMETATERIRIALQRGERVFILGDYDADGITSTALLVSALRKLGLKTYFYIPNRITEGYGVSLKGIQMAKDYGAGLIITADCGISSHDEISMAISSGMDVIITDHHEPPEKLPPAISILNPKRADSTYPFRDLAGVGVAYKLVQALIHDSRLEDLLDLVAIGSIADSVPLTGENRILVTYGLKKLNSMACRSGIKAIKEVAGIGNRELRSGMLSYTIIPRINAAGRLGDANEVVELFLTEDEERAKSIANLLEEQNRLRQKIEAEVYKSALAMLENNDIEKAIVLSSPSWHLGVIGIVASRLVEEFYRPTFLFSIMDSMAKGSARSIPPFHVYKGIAECKELLLGFGGHSQAAGLKLLTKNIPAFRRQINFIIERNLTTDDMLPILKIDADVELFEVNLNLVKELNMLEPFGNSNEEPLLGAKGIEVIDPRVVGNNHLKMRLKQRNLSIDTIGFDMGNLLEEDASGLHLIKSGVHGSQLVDAVFTPCINEWDGGKALQLNLKSLRPTL